MRIVIDLQSCQSGSRYGGIGRYSLALAKSMIRQGRGHEFWIVLNGLMPEAIRNIRREFIDLVPQDRIKVFYLPGPVAEANQDNHFRFQVAARLREAYIAQLKPDFVHVSSLFEGLFEESVTTVGLVESNFPTASTLYDLIPLVEKDKYLQEQFKLDWYLSKIEYLRSCSLSLSISEFSRREAIDLLSISEEHIVNISSAIDSFFRPQDISIETSNEIKKKFGILNEFLMYTGSFDQRKNHERLIRAYAELPESTRKKYQLVIVGNGWDAAYNLLKEVGRKSGLADHELVFAGHVSDSELLTLYNICRLFVFPSLCEGFGLPILEAMSCGTPVIGSNLTSIPEVIGMESALFDPYDIASISKKIYQALTDKNFYNKMLDHSLIQASNFSWDKSGVRALDALEAVYAEKKKTRRFWLGHFGRKDSDDRFIEEIGNVKGIELIKSEDFSKVVNSVALNSAGLEVVESSNFNKLHPQTVVWLTPWGVKCGIATYSVPVIEGMQVPTLILAPEEDNLISHDDIRVKRCWRLGSHDGLRDALKEMRKSGASTIIIQFNYGFYDFGSLNEFVETLVETGVRVFIILHSTKDPDSKILDRKLIDLKPSLSLAELFVHTDADVTRLKELGFYENVNLIPLGVHEADPDEKRMKELEGKFVISTYGFALPNKGLMELVEAFSIVNRKDPNTHLLMINAEFPAEVSSNLIQEIRKEIERLGLEKEITFIDSYLSNDESIAYLKASDLVVIPYQNTTESSSGSARMALVSGVPVAVTPLDIFDDIRQITITLPGFTSLEIASGISKIKDDISCNQAEISKIKAVTNIWLEAHKFKSVGRYLCSMVMEKAELYDSSRLM